ncbi:MAG: hypothetical protein Q9208_000358 [Pyrenodesmia sp. 3 TL-2023]
MAEEVRDADVTVPWSMILTTLANGALGFAMVVAVVFVTPNVDDVLASPTGQLGYPYMQIFYQSTGSKGMATVLTAILILSAVFGIISGLGSSIPIYAVVIASMTAAFIGIINIGSTAAFSVVISLSVSSLYLSYIITEAFLLYRRCTGGIRSRNPRHSTSNDELLSPETLTWGPFHVPGALGITVNIFAVCFGIVIFVFSFFPTATPVEPTTMNYSVLMLGAVIIFATLYYVIWARKQYVGPIVETTPHSVKQTVIALDSK